MRKIYLFCSAGMSTNILARRMQEAANEQKLEVAIKAFALTEIDEIYSQEHPDCILISPQVRFIYEETKERYKLLKVPVGLIDAKYYGTIDGEMILRQAILLMDEGVM